MIKPSIVEVIGQRVELRKLGKEYAGLCPFHDDKTPSFSVNEEKAVFYCHGCGAAGDVIDFIVKLDGVSFRQGRRISGNKQRVQTDASRSQEAAGGRHVGGLAK
jgi:DNA primase